jgi:ethanolamine utilization protein EutN
MQLARVVGEVVATVKHAALAGQRLMLVRPVSPTGVATGRAVIALDTVDAGTDDLVIVADEGNAAAQVLRRGRGPVRTVIVGVVDDVDTGPAPAAPAKDPPRKSGRSGA